MGGDGRPHQQCAGRQVAARYSAVRAIAPPGLAGDVALT